VRVDSTLPFSSLLSFNMASLPSTDSYFCCCTTYFDIPPSTSSSPLPQSIPLPPSPSPSSPPSSPSSSMTVFDAVSISSHHSQPLADLITSTSIVLFDQLPRHGKPTIRANGRHEWTILATISLVIHTYVELTPGIELIESTRVLPISLGTGVKVLPATKLPPVGDTIHDSHAEILARRGLVRWLIEESRRVARGTENEDVIEWYNGKFRLKEGVQTWLYVSALPVSFLVIVDQDPADISVRRCFNPPHCPSPRCRNGGHQSPRGSPRACSWSCSPWSERLRELWRDSNQTRSSRFPAHHQFLMLGQDRHLVGPWTSRRHARTPL